MLRKLVLSLCVFVVLAFGALIIIYVATGPQSPAADSVSAKWLQPGPFATATVDTVFVDRSRPTPANRDFTGAAERTLATTLWYPTEADAELPLVIHSHGFTSTRTDLSYAAELLASHGYVVAAADYPLTFAGAPGGPNSVDVINQPADITFLIDSIIALDGDAKPFVGDIDTARIGLMGYSLGGLTTEIATYHPTLRDPRIAAAVSIAGPTVGFTDTFFATADVPFLMIAGTLDHLINFDTNAAPIPKLIDNGSLLAIKGGTHLGFGAIADPMFRFMKHPDSLGCAAVLANLDTDPNETILLLGGAAEGIVPDPGAPAVCEITPDGPALHPGEQQRITSVGVVTFFESVFAGSPAQRASAATALGQALPRDFDAVGI